MSQKEKEMALLAEELEELKESPLYQYRVENDFHVVIGEGSLDAGIMFIGEAPGAREAKTGRPFVGASGRVLSELLASIDLERDDVYITNIVKDRPPDNRDPHVAEIELYSPFLMRQINIIRPKVIATLGRFSMDYILEKFHVPEHGQKISDLHGQPLGVETPYGNVVLVPLYHPAVALYNQGQRGTLEADFQVLKRYI